MPDAVFRHGNPIMVDYTPSTGAVNAGDFVPLGTGLLGIAHVDIANTEKAELAVGGGVYDMVVEDNYAAGTPVYYDGGDITSDADNGNNRQVGYMVEKAPDNATPTKVLHWPA